MLNVASIAPYVNATLTLTVLIFFACLCQRLSCEILPPHTPLDLFNRASRKFSLRNKRDTNSDSINWEVPCDPINWLSYTDPKFECGAWKRWGYNFSALYSKEELYSESTKVNYSSRSCVSLRARCDLVPQCQDGSDELGCFYQHCESPDDFLCESDLTCIPKAALCDGRFDCSDKSDEEAPHLYCHLRDDHVCEEGHGLIPCTYKSKDQFNNKCLPNDKICNGVIDCSTGIDESYIACHQLVLNESSSEKRSCGLQHFQCLSSLRHKVNNNNNQYEGILECVGYDKVCDDVPDCSDASDENQNCAAVLSSSLSNNNFGAQTESGTDTRVITTSPVIDCDGFLLLSNCGDDPNNATICSINYHKYFDPEPTNVKNNVTCPYPQCPFQLSDTEKLSKCHPICWNPFDRICQWSVDEALDRAQDNLTPLECLHYSAFCNGTSECSNQADELLCAVIECDNPSHFHCGGVAGQCLEKEKRCDGIPDCFNGTDEKDCSHSETHCKLSQFFCPDPDAAESTDNYSGSDIKGRCIDLSRACDSQLSPCANNIHKTVCDGLCRNKPHFCQDGARCVDSSTGTPHCQCDLEGYRYDFESKRCVDIDECNPDVSKTKLPCDQKCTNTEGSYFCSCYPGYYLNEDNQCLAHEQNAFILLTESHISVIDLSEPDLLYDSYSQLSSVDSVTQSSVADSTADSSQTSIAKTRTRHYFLNITWTAPVNPNPDEEEDESKVRKGLVTFVAYDYRRRVIYFADSLARAIYKTKLPSWNLTVILRKGIILNESEIFISGFSFGQLGGAIFRSEGMAVDYSSGNLYWVERQPNVALHVTSPDAKHDVALVRENLRQPREISLHVPKKYLFWVDWGTKKVERCNLDGSGRIELMKETKKFDFINSIVVDEFADRIYFLDAKYDEISFADLDGNNVGYVLKANTVIVHPFSLALFQRTVFFSDWGYKPFPRKINKCNKLACHTDLGSIAGSFHGSLHMAIVHQTLQDLNRVESYPCLINNGECGPDNFCLPLTVHSSRTDGTENQQTHSCYRPETKYIAADTSKMTSDQIQAEVEKALSCASKSESCLPASTRSIVTNASSIQFVCYCGPLSPSQQVVVVDTVSPIINGKSNKTVTVFGYPVLIVILIVSSIGLFALGGGIYMVISKCYTDHRQHKPVILPLTKPENSVAAAPDEEVSLDSTFGNPSVNRDNSVYASSPSYSPGIEATEDGYGRFNFNHIPSQMGDGVDVNCNGSLDSKYGHVPSNNNRQQSHLLAISRNQPMSRKQPLTSIIEETCEEDENDDLGCGDDENTSSTNSNSRIPRNYSIGSSTAGLINNSDDDVFENENQTTNTSITFHPGPILSSADVVATADTACSQV